MLTMSVCMSCDQVIVLLLVPEDEVWNYVSVNGFRNHGNLHDKLVLTYKLVYCPLLYNTNHVITVSILLCYCVWIQEFYGILHYN